MKAESSHEDGEHESLDDDNHDLSSQRKKKLTKKKQTSPPVLHWSFENEIDDLLTDSSEEERRTKYKNKTFSFEEAFSESISQLVNEINESDYKTFKYSLLIQRETERNLALNRIKELHENVKLIRQRLKFQTEFILFCDTKFLIMMKMM